MKRIFAIIAALITGGIGITVMDSITQNAKAMIMMN
jgi:hypothetical protein